MLPVRVTTDKQWYPARLISVDLADKSTKAAQWRWIPEIAWAVSPSKRVKEGPFRRTADSTLFTELESKQVGHHYESSFHHNY